MSNHKSTKSTIKNLEIQVGQLAKQLAENSSGNFRVNTKKNPKEECKAMITRSQGRMLGGKESKNSEGDLGEEKKKGRRRTDERKRNK